MRNFSNNDGQHVSVRAVTNDAVANAPDAIIQTARRRTSRGVKNPVAAGAAAERSGRERGREEVAAPAAVVGESGEEVGDGEDGDRAVNIAAEDARFTNQPPATISSSFVALTATRSFVPFAVPSSDREREQPPPRAPLRVAAATTASERDDVDPSNLAIGNRTHAMMAGTKATGSHVMN